MCDVCSTLTSIPSDEIYITSGFATERTTSALDAMCSISEREQNAALQDEEIEVLQAIFADEFQLSDGFDQSHGARSFTIEVPGPHSIVLQVHLPNGYPSTDAPVAVVQESFGLTNAQRDQITTKLDTIFGRSNGQVCLYEWVADVREVYATHQTEELEPEAANNNNAGHLSDPQEQVVCFSSDPHTLRSRTRTAQAVRDRDREDRLSPLIFHGGTIVDRKSVFQGHACPISCVADVRSFLAVLLDDRKVSRACHNMLAYRLTGAFTVKDNDEDREDGVGSKMLHLMELTKAEDVAVVVTRWCGGIHLGPDRFKHINACAREALEGGGFIDVSLPQSKKRKHRKQGPH
ncbi:Impact-like protein [Phytophthora cinnamomi]|uniref:Impact-like protein n=1 Tax=Phytophthora cinnamomi TaxID=4785 RepID=UPI00355A4AF9|nr:Impact-like protein [Phytophthora cinnamomi]